MKNETVISRIISAIFGEKIAIRENLYYDTIKGDIDFANDDIPNVRAVKAYLTSGGIPPTIIVAGTTGTPLDVAYSATSQPVYSLIRPDNSYDWNTNVYFDGAKFTIVGADDGSGKFADSFTFNIKP